MSRRLRVGLGCPDCRADRLILVSDGVDQLADDVSSRARDVPQGLVDTPARSFTTVERKIGADLAFHLHIKIRGVAENLQHYCAVLQYAPINLGSTFSRDVLGEAKLGLAEPQTPKVDESVLVLVPEVVNGPQVSAVEPPVSLWVGLQRLDQCLWAGADAPDLVHPTASAPRAAFGPLVEQLAAR